MMAQEISPGITKIGWIGTGVMGTSMCGHLVAAGYSATIYNRSPEKMAGLGKRAAGAAGPPREVAEASDVTFTIVGYPGDVRSVTLGPGGTLEGARPGSI